MALLTQILVCLVPEDERAILAAIRAKHPRTVLIDGSRWETPTPPVRESIGDCAARIVQIWDPATSPSLTARPRPDGRFDGPIIGEVVQCLRCRVVEDVLVSGRFAASCRDGEDTLRKFLEHVMACVQRAAPHKVALATQDGARTGVPMSGPRTRMGTFARAAIAQGPRRAFRDGSSPRCWYVAAD